MKKNVKRVVTIVLAAIILLSLTACSGGTESAESGGSKELNIYMWSGYLAESVVDGFEEEYGITVNMAYMNSSEEAVAKITSGGGDEYDLAMPCDANMTSLIKGGFLEEIDLSALTNLDNISDDYLNRAFDPENKYAIPYLMNYIYVLYNEETCPIELNDYNDLLDPALKGQIVTVSGIRNLFPIALIASGYNPNSTDEGEIEVAYNWLVKYMENVKVVGEGVEKSLLSGDCSVAYIFDGAAGRAIREMDSLKVAEWKDPIQLGFDNFVIPKGAKNKENAELFLNYILNAEVMAENLIENPYTCPNEAAVEIANDDYKNNPAINISDEMKGNYFLQLDVGDAAVIYDKYWTKLMSQQ